MGSILNPPPFPVRPPERMPDGSIRGYIVEEYVIPAEVIPDIDNLVIEDGTPVDNVLAEKQQRLLIEPLYSCWPGPGEGRPFFALAKVGLFYQLNAPALVPDVMLSIDVESGRDLSLRENRSYFTWIVGKVPDAAIEFVSDKRGGEAGEKMDQFARIGVPYYVIFDPLNRLKAGTLRAFAISGGTYMATLPDWLEGIGLGLTLWNGSFEGRSYVWLRWCDKNGAVIPTGAEKAALEQKRAEHEKQRAEHEKAQRERLEAKLRELGVDPKN